MSSITSPPSSAWGALGAPDWRHAPAQGPSATTPARGPAGAGLGSGGSWFESTGAAGLSADVSPAARGLSVQQHAERVLSLLLG